MSLTSGFLLFIGYSFIGWIIEVIYASIYQRRLVNRGFLYGPISPIFGVGALLAASLLGPFSGNLFYLSTLSFFLVGALEYAASWGFEMLFSIKLWEYARSRFTLHGRVCLWYSLFFAALAVLTVIYVHPFCYSVVKAIPPESANVVAIAFLACLAIDLFFSVRNVRRLDEGLLRLEEVIAGTKDREDSDDWFDERDLMGSLQRLKDKVAREGTESARRFYARFERAVDLSNVAQRLFKAFPSIKSLRHPLELEFLKPKSARRESARNEPAIGSFAQGFNFYKVFWVYLIASNVGVVLEVIYCVLTIGHIESRAGLIYGWQNPVYGVGAVIMTLALAKLEKRRDLLIFVASMFIGGFFEYLCSLGQELAFGTISWSYKGTQLNLHGRTNFYFALMWGFLGLVWVRYLYPQLSKLIEKIPNRVGKPLTWLLLVALVFDVAISAGAVSRWSHRAAGEPAANAAELFLDEHYTDSTMHRIYPHMRFVRGSQIIQPQ